MRHHPGVQEISRMRIAAPDTPLQLQPYFMPLTLKKKLPAAKSVPKKMAAENNCMQTKSSKLYA